MIDLKDPKALAALTDAQRRWTLLIRPDETSEPEALYVPTVAGAKFHDCRIANAILEGPRGTGKSTILRFEAHMYALRNPGMTYLIVRRTFPELNKSHLGFIEHEMKQLGGHYNKGEKIAYYPNGSKGYFGHCETDADVMIYLSSQFARLYLDEITTFPGDMILKLASTVRVPKETGWDAVLRGGTNPLGEGADFVNRWFIDKSVPPDEADDYDPADYHAQKMTRDDNPHLDWAKYDKVLSRLPEHVRRAWQHGEWVAEGAYFADFKSMKDGEPWHVITRLPTVNGVDLLSVEWIQIYRVLDWGFYPDPAVCLWIALLPNGRAIVFKEKAWTMTTAKDVAADIKRESHGMRIVDTLCDPTMFVNDEATGNLSVGRIVENAGIPLTPAVNDRAAAGLAIHEWLNTILDERPKIQIVKDACPMLLRTIPEMRQDKTDPRKIANGNDHWVISLAYFCMQDAQGSRAPRSSAIPLWMRLEQTGKQFRIGAKNVRDNG